MGRRLDKVSYELPVGFSCPSCGNESACIIPLDNCFDYDGTHCTGGRGGVHYPGNYGAPVTDCCEAPVPDAEIYCPF